MRLFGRLARGATALAMMASLTGCFQQPVAPHTPVATPASPDQTGPGSASPSNSATPTNPTVVSAMLPTETLPVRVLAISGEHVLVQGDGGFTYRLSHDGGRTWTPTDFPCADPDGCSVVPPTSDQVGRAVDGIVAAYSSKVRQLEAYSLVSGRTVGTPLTIVEADSVYDMAGGLVLLYNSLSDSYRVRSLLDGSERAVAAPAGSAFRLFDDGSVLVSDTQTRTTSQRVAPNGSTTTIPFPMGGDAVVNGTVVWFGRDRAHKPPEFCAYDVLTERLSCRGGVTKWDHGYAVGSTGMMLSGYTGTAVRLYWLAYSGGSVAAPRQLATLRAWDSGRVYSAENAAPLVAVRSENAGSLARPEGGRTTMLELDWAVRPVLPAELALGSEAVLGSVATHSGAFLWARRLSSSVLGAQRRAGSRGQVAASGSRWALFTGDTIGLYDHGRRVRSLRAPAQGESLTFAGDYLFTRPSCRRAPLQTDEDCESFVTLLTPTGKRLSVPPAAEDAHGNLLVSRGGDTTVASTTFVITDFVDAGVSPVTIDLPDPGTGGYYTDVQLWGDWIGATQHLPDGTMHPVLADFRTATVKTGIENSRFLALGDGMAVSALAHTTTLQVWEFTTGVTQTLAASSTVVAVDGTRLAYTTPGGALAVADFAR